MVWSFRNWRRRRLLKHHPLPDALWQAAVRDMPLLAGLSEAELARLKEWVTLFLHEKAITAAAGLVLTEAMRLNIAIQACLPILNLDLDYYRGWVEVIVYPDEFVPEYEYTDEHGLVHHVREPMSGEAWLGGPVILSWRDVGGGHGIPGYNVVIHEFAHKLDMQNGEPNGFPPLHRDMSRQAWSEAWRTAYEDFCRRVAADEHTPIDPYAAESPGEFFAVLSEIFFETPEALLQTYPAVYEQLARFYRQDPAARRALTVPSRISAPPS
ncbi:zinc-dependent peptidase [Thiobacter aerophilum]|uniref:M90 family metallopeptidase n=1 Tax=Thiobacter aerophilum TaxID=3121275 RepID=A0ABV0EBD0_9BURK